jgi:hypothetical protein
MSIRRESPNLNDQDISRVVTRIRQSFVIGRIPLFIIGAGVSYGLVPRLKEIGSWLLTQLEQSDSGIFKGHDWVIEYCKKLASDSASRRETTELFTLLQGEVPTSGSLMEEFNRIWGETCKNCLLSVPSDIW